MVDIYALRQWFLLVPGLLYSICLGYVLGFPAVLNQSLVSEPTNRTDAIKTTSDHTSWIFAINGVGGVMGSFTLPMILHYLGRKAAHVSINVNLLVGWIIIYLATDISALYAARFIQGMGLGYVNIIMMSEYVHPSRRGYFITLKKMAIAFGTLCCHAMEPFWTWKQITIFAAIPALLAIILTLFWPESPSYLAMKKRYTECEASFTWINGSSEESRKLLKLLVDTQKKKNQKKKSRTNHFTGLLKKFLMKDFQKSFAIVTLLTLGLDLCGRYYFVAYVIKIMKEILENKTSALYFTLSSDFLTFIALFSSSIIIRYIKRRTILFTFGAIATALMLLISILIYLKSVYVFSRYFLLFIAFVIVLQCFIVNLGLIPVSFAIIAEIFPLEHKSFGACASGLVFTSFYALTLKLTPVLMEHTNLYGTYAIYGIALALCLIVLYKIVPETKDKPLEEIEENLNGRTSDLVNNVLLSPLVVNAK